MIAYKHKKTGCVITTEELKVYLKKDCRLMFHKAEPVLPFNFQEEVAKIERYEYNIKDIPFSDDFEAFEIESSFNINELAYIIHTLNADEYRPEFAFNIVPKLIRKKENLMLYERGYCYE